MASASAGIGSALPSQVGQSGNYLTTDGTVATWATVSASGITSFGAVGSSPSANGATVSGAVATLQPADATHPGLVTTAAQSWAGVKTFTSVPVAAGINGTGTSATTGFVIDTPSIGTGNILDVLKAGFNVFKVDNNGQGTFFGSVASGGTLFALGVTLSGANPSTISMKSPNGTTFAVTVSNAGALVVT